MRVTQISLYCASFAGALIGGNLSDFAFWQAGFHAKDLLGDKPLPPLSQFLITNHQLPAYLPLLPWLVLVAWPLLTTGAGCGYWRPQPFALRYLAFLSCEFLLFGVLVLALAMPFIPLYRVIEVDHQANPVEITVRVIFWLIAASVVLLVVRRSLEACRLRNPSRE